MDHGLLYINLTEAISEGDGDRVMRCCKFLLLHFYSDPGSTKYALEALFLQFQQQALFIPRQAYRQRWNRSVNNRGGRGKNVSLDLEIEHGNNVLKEALRKMGLNPTHSAVTRSGRMLNMARQTVDKVARECDIMKRLGKHFIQSNNKKDLSKIVGKLLEDDALSETTGRAYRHFHDFKKSFMTNLRMGRLCAWINEHKYEMVIALKAR